MSALTFQNILNGTGFHQANNYEISVSIPANSKLLENFRNAGVEPQKVSQMFSDCCYQVNPAVGSIQTSTVRTYGEPFEIPYGKTYEPITFGFYLDNDGLIYKILNLWYETIFDSSCRVMSYLEDYACDVEIIFCKRGSETGNKEKNFMKIVLEKAYPKTLSPIPLSGMSSNTATQFDVTFTYRRAIYHYFK